MPFKSYRQQRYMFKYHPDIATRWADKYGALKKPEGYKPRKIGAMAKKMKKK